MATLRVLHAIGTSEIGGTERFLVDLVQRHRVAGIESCICVMDQPGSLAPAYEAVARSVHHLEVGRNVLRSARQWRTLLKRLDPAVVVLYGTRANLLGRMVRGPARPPLITALRSTVVDDRAGRFSPALDRTTFQRVAACVSNSRAALDALLARGYPLDRLSYIPPGIDVPRFASGDRMAARESLGIAPAEMVLLCVANLKPVKNHRMLLEVSASLAKRGIAHKLWLVGEGPDRPALEQLAREHPTPGTVVFAGRQSDPGRHYAAADLFLLASTWEGAPTAVLEAMAAGVPVVASRVGDIPEVVLDGIHGRLVAPNDLDGFTAAVVEGCDPGIRRVWAEAARQHVRSFSAESAASRYARLFEWAAEGSPRPVPFAHSERVRPVRILRVLSRLNVGGPAVHVVLLTAAMNRGAMVSKLVSGSVGPGEGDMGYLAAERRVAVHLIPTLGRSVNVFRDVTALVALFRLMLRFRPDVIHTHASKAGALGRVGGLMYNFGRPRRLRAALVHTYHGHTFEGYFGRVTSLVYRTVERALGRLTDCVVVLSELQRSDIVNRFRIVRGDRVRLVPLGLDLAPLFAVDEAQRVTARASLGIAASDRVIVTVGRLTAIKDQALLLRAFASLPPPVQHARLLIVGDGELRAPLESLARALRLSGAVTFLGWRRDLAAVYAAADVTALSSINEGTPVALIEAIAAGCPVVATAVGGVPDVVDDSSGILVQGRSEQAFTAALAGALLRGRLEAPVRERMRRYSIERLVADLESVYSQLLRRLRGV